MCGRTFLFYGQNHYWNIYIALLEQFVFPQVDDIERENAPGVVFRQDGTLRHFRLQVCLTWNARFPNQWTGRGGSIARPPKGPDLTPLRFFMWWYMKNIVL
jgi:hypothetical protein